MASRAHAVAAAQALLQRRFPSVKIDGLWGPKTQDAFDAADHDLRVAVIKTVADNGQSLNDIQAQMSKVPRALVEPASSFMREVKGNGMTQKRADIIRLVTEIAKREDVPVNTALRICWLESKFDPMAVSPTYAKGLFQMTGIAKRDVRERGGFDLEGREFDPEANATAGMRYIKLVARDLRVPLTDTVRVYMGFNIGPTAARLYLAGHITPNVRQVILQQAYGPPEVYGARLAAAVNSVPALA